MEKAKTVSGPNMLHTKDKDYIFNRVLYVEDYFKFFDKVEAFNPDKHKYIREIEIPNENPDVKLHPDIEDKLALDIVKMSDEQKNKYIRTQMVSLLHKLESSRFFYYEPDVYPTSADSLAEKRVEFMYYNPEVTFDTPDDKVAECFLNFVKNY
ncbi:MAG: hypothetical protein IJ224_04075 [Lachnospiraceae bacterium]|nr:hypothetical protein [Lachnospiraceae bacterium]